MTLAQGGKTVWPWNRCDSRTIKPLNKASVSALEVAGGQYTESLEVASGWVVAMERPMKNYLFAPVFSSIPVHSDLADRLRPDAQTQCRHCSPAFIRLITS
jgi:hypothetical protein